MSKGLGKIQQKILLLILSGIALSLTRSPQGYYKIVGGIKNEWKWIDQNHLQQTITGLYKSKFIEDHENADGTVTLILTSEGKSHALRYDLKNIHLRRPKHWDKKWRIVLFDVPIKKNQSRKVFRNHLCDMGFFQLQKSVLIHPYPCKDEIEFLIEVYQLKKYVRFIIAESLDNELHIKKLFGLI